MGTSEFTSERATPRTPREHGGPFIHFIPKVNHMMQTLTTQEIEQVQGGFGPVTGIAGGVLGAASAGAGAWATGQSTGQIISATLVGGLLGGFMGATRGMVGIAGIVRSIHVGSITAAASMAGGMPRRTHVQQ